MQPLRILVLFAMIFLGSFTQIPTVSAAGATDLVVCPDSPSVYYLGEDGNRYVFQNELTFLSWHHDFTTVQTVACKDLASFPLVGVVWYQAGTSLVKIPSDPTVYAVEPGGVLRPIAQEATAVALFGPHWADRVDDLSEVFLPQYKIADQLVDGEIPKGTILKSNDNNLYRYEDLDDDEHMEAVEMDELDDNDSLNDDALDLEDLEEELEIEIETIELEDLEEELIDRLRAEIEKEVLVLEENKTDVEELDEINETEDHDNDELSDEEDADDDNDGIVDTQDKHPFDHDNDGLEDTEDSDDDNDGISDTEDEDALDHDNDGLEDTEDSDDDGDGIQDTEENDPVGNNGDDEEDTEHDDE